MVRVRYTNLQNFGQTLKSCIYPNPKIFSTYGFIADIKYDIRSFNANLWKPKAESQTLQILISAKNLWHRSGNSLKKCWWESGDLTQAHQVIKTCLFAQFFFSQRALFFLSQDLDQLLFIDS